MLNLLKQTKAKLSTPHGALGTSDRFTVAYDYSALSTPHGALGTEEITEWYGHPVEVAFNSTRCIRNIDSGSGSFGESYWLLSTPHGALGTF